VNALVAQHWAAGGGGGAAALGSQAPRLSPERGNVCFASSAHGWCFSLLSFAKVDAPSSLATPPPLDLSLS
jgi:U5 small nuclear ribonucleoprotein component